MLDPSGINDEIGALYKRHSFLDSLKLFPFIIDDVYPLVKALSIMYVVVLLVCCSWVALLCPSVQAYGKVDIYYTLNLVLYKLT